MVKVSNEDGVSRKLFNCCSLFSLEIERVKWNVAGVNGGFVLIAFLVNNK